MRVLCLDIGFKRIGLAYCDSLFITVSILPAIKRKKDTDDLKTIGKHIKEQRISGLIFGLPLDDKGEMTKQADDCKNYGELVSKEFSLPFAFVNEHSSTWESINKFNLKKDKSGLVDSISAKIILEQWISEGPELKEIMGKNE